MKREILLTWIAVLGAGLLALQANAQETQALKTQKEKVSYGIGVDLARDLQRQGIQVETAGTPAAQSDAVDLDLLIKGLKDALIGQKLLMPEREMRRILISYQGELRRKQVRTGTVPSEVNRREGEAFLADNKTKEGVVTLPNGLQYKVLKAGTGKKPTDADTVEVNYRGTLIDGTEFDSSSWGQPKTFKMNVGVIPGWAEALKLMPAGSTWLVFIPSRLAYGDRGKSPNVGPNETLVYELELVAVK